MIFCIQLVAIGNSYLILKEHYITLLEFLTYIHVSFNT